MPGFTYLSDSEVRAWRTVPGDKDCNDLLQEFRQATGEDWVIGVREYDTYKRKWHRLGRKVTGKAKFYTLYADCHGEWQVINLVTPEGGSVFHGSKQSREDVMNFMLGYLAGIYHTGPVNQSRRVTAEIGRLR